MKKPTKATRPSEVESTFPSPAEVERMCSEIQTHWSVRDRRRRSVASPGPWSAPTIKVAEISRDKTPHWALSFH